MGRSSREGFTLVELLVVIIILSILMALLLPSVAAAIKNARIMNCSANLNQLSKAMYNYASDQSSLSGSFPTGPAYEGGPFWVTLQVRGEIDNPALLSCPVSGTTALPGTTHYQGPRGNPNLYKSNDAIGADNRLLNLHGPSTEPGVFYNWVARSGDVHKLPNDSSVSWAEIESKVKP